MRQHVFKSAAAIVRSFIMYKPYLIFGWSAILFGVLGFVPFVRYAVLVSIGDGGGHLQSLILGGLLLTLSFLSRRSVISDLIRTNRVLLETTLEHAKRHRFAGEGSADHGATHLLLGVEDRASMLGRR